MFLLLRSAFWLTLAFLVLRPGVDLGGTASNLSSEAMARGSQFVAQQIQSIECKDLTCAGGKAIAAAALQPLPSAGIPMHVEPASASVPYPRPRPNRAG